MDHNLEKRCISNRSVSVCAIAITHCLMEVALVVSCVSCLYSLFIASRGPSLLVQCCKSNLQSSTTFLIHPMSFALPCTALLFLGPCVRSAQCGMLWLCNVRAAILGGSFEFVLLAEKDGAHVFTVPPVKAKLNQSRDRLQLPRCCSISLRCWFVSASFP